MNDQFKNIEPMVYRSMINVPYTWWAGDTASEFLTALKEQKKIIGLKCGKCARVYVPPRKVCPDCFTKNEKWVELSGEGTLETYTVARRQLASIPRKVPVIYGMIRLDGADTSMLHFIEKTEPDKIMIGMRLKAVFAEEREGNIMDISCFVPV